MCVVGVDRVSTWLKCTVDGIAIMGSYNQLWVAVTLVLLFANLPVLGNGCYFLQACLSWAMVAWHNACV